MRQTVRKFDSYFITQVDKWPRQLYSAMLFLTIIGGPVGIAVVSLVIGLEALLTDQKYIVVALVLAACASIVNILIKYIVHRARPNTNYARSMKIKLYSFPSGHSLASAVTYGIVGYIGFTSLSAPLNWLVVLLSGLIIILVGISRVYLGAHYPSDVVAGWLFGFLCLWLIVVYILS